MIKATHFIILINVFLLTSNHIRAQTDKDSEKIRVKVAYSGMLLAPGLRAGLELPTTVIIKEKKRRSGASKTIEKHRMLDVNLGWYHHPEFHDNLYLTAGWTWRRVWENQWFIDFSPALGYSRTFNGATTYSVVDNRVVRRENFGYNYLLADLGTGLGYSFSKNNLHGLAVFGKLNFMFVLPYNSYFLLKPLFQLGVMFTPAHYISVKNKKDKK